MADQSQLQDEVRKLIDEFGRWAVASVTDRMGSATQRLTQGGGGGSDSGGVLPSAVSGGLTGGVPGALKGGAKGMVKSLTSSAKGLLGGGGDGGGGSSEIKVTTIVESIDVGVPVKVAYNLWTEYAEFPNYTKGVESVEVDDEEQQNVEWKAHVAFSHRTWQATVTEQVPDKRIVWTSKGNKGFVDGAVTFHEVAPELTRILVVLEYHPQGFVEWIANRWRAAGRRARLDLKHYRRHVMTRTLISPEEVEGWRGEIRDGEVVKDHETAVREEREAGQDERTEPENRDEDREPDDLADEEEESGDEQDRSRGEEPVTRRRPGRAEPRRREEVRTRRAERRRRRPEEAGRRSSSTGSRGRRRS